MYQVTVTTTTLPMTEVCYNPLTTTKTITVATTSMVLAAALGQYNVVLLPPLRPGVTMRVLLTSALCHCHSSNLSPSCLLRLMPIMSLVLLRWVFCFRLNPHQFLYVGIFCCLLPPSGSYRHPCSSVRVYT